tara:strand:- start:279 stop:413 length:135 start_codon:yes stop_codon:yes gene_type:complete
LSNFANKPIKLLGGTADAGSTPALIEVQKKLFDDLGANTDITIE